MTSAKRYGKLNDKDFVKLIKNLKKAINIYYKI
jgi:hypothetical protein